MHNEQFTESTVTEADIEFPASLSNEIEIDQNEFLDFVFNDDEIEADNVPEDFVETKRVELEEERRQGSYEMITIFHRNNLKIFQLRSP